MAERRLVDILDDLDAAGYPPRLLVRPGGVIHCARCGADTPGALWTVAQTRRLEGATDPAEQVLILGLVGPPSPCGCRGSLVLGYGPAASADDAAVLAVLDVPSARDRAPAWRHGDGVLTAP